jgi:DNA-binding NarL/FixJ family response regulator
VNQPAKRHPILPALPAVDSVSSPIGLVVIEDNPLLREGLAAALGAAPGVKLLAAAADGADALEVVHATKPDVVLLDLGLAEQDSLALTARVHGEVPTAKVVVMGLLPTQEDVTKYVQAGASGFIMKDASLDDFLATIRAVADGTEVLPQALTNSLFTQIARMAIRGSEAQAIEAVRLTARERQIIALIGEGQTDQDIAIRLGITIHELRSEVHNAMEKLALHRRLEQGGIRDGAAGEV